MFFYKEYNHYIININIQEKTRFYTYKYYNNIKSIIVLLQYIRFRYDILPSMYDNVTLVRNNLFFFSNLNSTLFFKRFNLNIDSYSVVCSKNKLYQYNILYYYLLSYFRKEFKDQRYMEIVKGNNNIYKNLKINFSKLLNVPANNMFNEVKTVNSFVNCLIQTNSSNYYINKLFYSHTFFYI